MEPPKPAEPADAKVPPGFDQQTLSDLSITPEPTQPDLSIIPEPTESDLSIKPEPTEADLSIKPEPTLKQEPEPELEPKPEPILPGEVPKEMPSLHDMGFETKPLIGGFKLMEKGTYEILRSRLEIGCPIGIPPALLSVCMSTTNLFWGDNFSSVDQFYL